MWRRALWWIVRCAIVCHKRVRLKSITTATIYRDNNTAVVAFVLWVDLAATVSWSLCIRVTIGMAIEIAMYASIGVGITGKVVAVGNIITTVAFQVAQVSALDRLVFLELLSGFV